MANPLTGLSNLANRARQAAGAGFRTIFGGAVTADGTDGGRASNVTMGFDNNPSNYTPTGQPPPDVSPYEEAGVSGTAIWGGFVQVIEQDRRLVGANKWRTISDMLANVSIVAASARFFLNLCASPTWNVSPAKDIDGEESSDAAKAVAEFVQAVLDDMATPWPRIVRRQCLYRFNGFGVHEWTAKRREDGLIGFTDIESRPCHTIERWQPDENGTITGMWQRSPQNGQLYWLPREKVIYLVDDTLTDSPEGMGLFRQLIDPSDRIQRYLKLEGQGYERDLRGIPVGRAPIAALDAAVKAGEIKKTDAENALAAIRKFVKLQVKAEDTGLLLDSSAYESPTADGFTVSSKDLWGIDLVTGQSNGFSDLGKAIERIEGDMARIVGTQMLLFGAGGHSGSSGNRALAEDASRNLYLGVQGTVKDVQEQVQRDAISQLCVLNAIPKELYPTLEPEDVAFKDVEQLAAVLKDMALAGAVLAPDDPAINDIRDIAGLSHAPEQDLSIPTPMPGEPIPGAPGPNAQPAATTPAPQQQSPRGPAVGAPAAKDPNASNLAKWLTGRGAVRRS